ncbi:putative pentatricopeptide repeat-containing protein [Panicum miliaceum]|uniref:Pentatricopeptide repeat-containing protein n=1 Tax=Panicum miliaceum TaxID=4540 RepID=A0A3L6QF68_PANMI|nr:putative pentatricopeptide repeat-containing protein [Panicum miliaceum]
MTRPLCNHYAALLSSTAGGRSGAQLASVVHCLILRTLPHPPPVHLLNHLLIAYGKAGRHARARRLFAMPHPNLFTYNALLTRLAHARLLDDMDALFASMPERDVVSYNALIAGFSGAGSHTRAAGAYRALLREDTAIRPSRITMSAMVMAASALGDRALGRQFHCQILRLGFGAYAFVGSPLVDMYAKMGLIGDAKRVFDELEGKNVVMYNTMITGLLRCKMVQEARRLFEVMTDRDSITWTTMVTGLTQNGLESEALEVFRRMRVQGIAIDQYTFGSTLTACGALSALEQGKQIHTYTIRTCYDDNVFVGSALVDMYSKCRSIRLAETVFRRMTFRNHLMD